MIQIAICNNYEEDIKKVKNLIVEYMENKNMLYNISIFLSGERLVNSNQKFDIIYLDILLKAKINGITTGKIIRNNDRMTKIIYITHLPSYLEEAINDVHAFAYLEKPLQKNKFIKQLKDALYQFEEETAITAFQIMEITKEGYTDKVIKEFNIEDIYYFEYINRKIKIKSKDGEYYFLGQMKSLKDKMSKYPFESCHQNYLIQLKYAKKIKGYNLYLINGDTIPISQKKASSFRQKLFEYMKVNRS